MTPKQRFEAAMNFKQPDDMVAMMEIEFHIYEEYIGKKLIVGYEFANLSSTEKEKALDFNAEAMIQTAEKAGHDAIRNLSGYWEISPGEPAFIWLPDYDSQLAQLRALKRAAGDKYFIIGNGGGGMLGIPDGNRINEFITEIFEKPDEVKRNCEQRNKNGIESQKKNLDAGADAIILCCDVAFNNGPFMSPAMMDEFFFPYFYEWVDSLKSQGVISIWHTDGNLCPILDKTVASGVTAIQCVDPLGGMDIVEIKKQVDGKLALIGNIDCSNLQLGTKESIEAEVKRVVLGCKGNGGFVLSGCNAIFNGISADNYQVMVDARLKYGLEG